MHWREGFRRSARAAAIVYWLGAAVAVGVMYHDTVYEAAYEFRRANPAGWGEFDPVADNAFKVLIPAPPPPPQPNFTKLGVTAAAKTFGWSLLIYVSLLAAFRGLRWIARGFLDGRPA